MRSSRNLKYKDYFDAVDSEPVAADDQSDVEDNVDESGEAEEQESDEEDDEDEDEDYDMYVWLTQTEAFKCDKTNFGFMSISNMSALC